jgi:hypothetical protein
VGAGWSWSFALGSLRLTATALKNDPPERSDIAVGRLQAAIALRAVDVSPAEVALAAGGTARALSKLVGAQPAEMQLNQALTLLSSEPSHVLAARFGFAGGRGRLRLVRRSWLKSSARSGFHSRLSMAASATALALLDQM